MAREQAALVAAQQESERAVALGTLLQTIFQSITEGIIVYDRDGVVRHINNAARTFLELGPEAACVGKTYQDLFGHYERYNEAMEPISLEHLPMHAVSQGQAASCTRIANLLVRFPSGAECYLDLTWTPLHDQQGQTAGVISIFRDVTTRHQQERRIRHAFELLSSLMEAMVHLPLQAVQPSTEEHFVAVSLSEAGQCLCEMIRQMLDCAMAGLVEVEGPQKRMHLVGVSGLAPEALAHVQQDLMDSTLSDYLDEASIAQLHANQVVLRDLVSQPFVRRSTYGMHHFLLAPMLLEGKLVGTFGIDRPREQEYTQEDIALVKVLAKLATLVLERVRLLHAWAQTHANELALQEANRRFDTFLSLASHELRTPLTGIRGSIQLSLRRLEKLARQEQMAPLLTDETTRRLRHPLEEAIGRVTSQDRMISDLLDVSRIQAGHLEMILRPANLVEIVQHALEDIQYLAPERIITLHKLAEECLPIMADADRIGQVVSNYLSNALKYSASDRPVELWLTREGATARVAVKDHGPGLTQEEQQGVWDRFHRVKGIQVQYGTGAGLGLGLYLCRTIIERHGGQVGVESKKGEGSTFWFTLPLTPERS